MKKKLYLIMFVLAFLPWNTGCSSRVAAKKEGHIDVNTCNISSQEIQIFIETTGSVQADLEGRANIVSPLDGIVDRIFVKAGDRVRKGEHLLAVRSSGVSDTYANYLSVHLQLKQAERVYDLNKDLYQFGAITKNDLINTEANCEQLKAVEEGVKRKLNIYGINLVSYNNSQDSLTIKAPIEGVVVDIQTHTGDRVDSTTSLMTVADPGKVLVVANIYDTDIKKVLKGNEVIFSTDIFPEREFRGIITYVSDAVDVDSKTVKTYIKVSNDENLFKLNMFLKIKIADNKTVCQVIPKSSLLYKDGKFYAYVKGKEGCKLKKIKPISEVSENLIAVEGLADLDEIVLAAIDMEKT